MRLIGSWEWLPECDKTTVAEQAILGLSRKKLDALHGSLFWTIGRLGSRVPVYATLQQVVRVGRVQAWIEKMIAIDPGCIQKHLSLYSLCLMQMSRRTGDRYRDIPASLRDRVCNHLKQIGAPELHIELVTRSGGLDKSIEESIVGDVLPLGFRLANVTGR